MISSYNRKRQEKALNFKRRKQGTLNALLHKNSNTISQNDFINSYQDDEDLHDLINLYTNIEERKKQRTVLQNLAENGDIEFDESNENAVYKENQRRRRPKLTALMVENLSPNNLLDHELHRLASPPILRPYQGDSLPSIKDFSNQSFNQDQATTEAINKETLKNIVDEILPMSHTFNHENLERDRFIGHEKFHKLDKDKKSSSTYLRHVAKKLTDQPEGQEQLFHLPSKTHLSTDFTNSLKKKNTKNHVDSHSFYLEVDKLKCFRNYFPSGNINNFLIKVNRNFHRTNRSSRNLEHTKKDL